MTAPRPQLRLFEESDDDGTRPSRKPWAWLLRHVFEVDVTICPEPEHGGHIQWIDALALTLGFGVGGAILA